MFFLSNTFAIVTMTRIIIQLKIRIFFDKQIYQNVMNVLSQSLYLLNFQYVSFSIVFVGT